MRYIILALVALLPACATIIEGTSDNVTVSTTPAGASCNIDRNGERVGAISPTPGSVRIDKSKRDLTVACTKEGYQPATVTAESRFTGTTFGNIILGGLLGVVVDLSSGANNKYPGDVRVELAANPRPVEPPPAPMAMEPVDSATVRPVLYRRLRAPGV